MVGMAVITTRQPAASKVHQHANYGAQMQTSGVQAHHIAPEPSQNPMSLHRNENAASGTHQYDHSSRNSVNGQLQESNTSFGSRKSVVEGTQGNPRAFPSEQSNIERQPRAQLVRSQSDYDRDLYSNGPDVTEQNWELRHGWEDQYNSEEYLHLLSSAFYMYYTDKRHETGGKPKQETIVRPPEDWSHRDRTKTVSAALVVCLNLGVDPPDIIKTNPCASTECWIDPVNQTVANPKILESIGKKLQEQYENLSIKTRYKQYLDPSIEETKKFCVSLRRNAKEERVLFHYNGHGVPRPTPSGEIWVFNRDYTQYIPIALYDLQLWLGGPSLFIFDCSHAASIIISFERCVEKHEAENAEIRDKDPNAQLQNFSNNIQLAACGKKELLPTNPKLPADLFTCCLTTPIDMSIRFHALDNPLQSDLNVKDMKNKVPGRAAERRSPMGELNCILTAITDTIAWNALPRVLFRKLFRQDLMVAALFRNYLVAERIMTAYGCHPTSSPQIPETHSHPLWEAWDLAIEMVLAQLPAMQASEDGTGPIYEYKTSTFFTEQLTAFEVYLQQGAPQQELPTQLPIVLQVLLSQAHRLRALILLSKFLDLGPWAVNLALTIGIFPYVVKLLQSPAVELKPIMIFIWARIIAVESEQAQTDLLKDNGYQYFTNILLPHSGIPVGNASEHKAMSAFVIAMFCRDNPQAQTVCVGPELIDACIDHLQDPENPLLRQWSCLCISMLWANYADAKWMGIRCDAHHRLCALVIDPVPEVRAAAIHALTNFLGIPDLTEQVAQNEETIASALMAMTTDGNAMVRIELLVFYSTFVKRYQKKFLVAAYETWVNERENLIQSSSGLVVSKANGFSGSHQRDDTDDRISQNSVQGGMWLQLLVMTVDAHPEVAQAATAVVDYVHEKLLESPLASHAQRVIDNIIDLTRHPAGGSRPPSVAPTTRQPPLSNTNGIQPSQKQEGYLSIGMRRTASIGAALKSFMGASASADNLASTFNSTQQNAQLRPSVPARPGVPAEWSTPPDQHDPTSTSVRYQKAKLPLPRGFKAEREKDTSTIPLKSGFFDWSVEYFREPQMKPNEPDEPGSDDYNSRLWRRVRNEKTLAMTQPLKGVAGTNRWDIDAGFFNNGSQPMKMSFHQFEEHLAIADDRDSICVWNWGERARMSRFSNGNPKGSRITEARFINEDDQAMLMTGSSDGVIKIFRNYWSEKNVELVSAFRALTDLIPSTKNAGLVLDWQQGQGKLLVAGDVKLIRVWNAATEICTNVSSHPENPIPSFIKPANSNTGHPRPIELQHNVAHLRPSSRQRFLCWLRRRCHPSLRSASQAQRSHDPHVART